MNGKYKWTQFSENDPIHKITEIIYSKILFEVKNIKVRKRFLLPLEEIDNIVDNVEGYDGVGDFSIENDSEIVSLSKNIVSRLVSQIKQCRNVGHAILVLEGLLLPSPICFP